ncbi:MAG: DUF2059 domain-containing protein [Paludibacter sp.]|nr:DUF2059 domain-containing protein [Paludibacter sp.]
MKKLLPVILLLLLITSSTYSQDDKEYSKAIRKMYVVMGTDNTFKAAIKQMISTYKTKFPYNSSWNEIEAELIHTSIDELIVMMTPVYRRHMTLSDIEAITAFYQTPTGQKYAKQMPAIVQESIQVGQEWGQKISKKIEEKVKENKDKKE